MEPLKFDTRIIERNIKKGILSKKEYEAHLANLRDLSEESEPIEVSLYKEPQEAEETSKEAAPSETDTP
ncbi:MAG: hypothetical protein QNJ97_22530 [Myxococcota bacterium]|nr:hypothetical protein [Myxococcota bacterium]